MPLGVGRPRLRYRSISRRPGTSLRRRRRQVAASQNRLLVDSGSGRDPRRGCPPSTLTTGGCSWSHTCRSKAPTTPPTQRGAYRPSTGRLRPASPSPPQQLRHSRLRPAHNRGDLPLGQARLVPLPPPAPGTAPAPPAGSPQPSSEPPDPTADDGWSVPPSTVAACPFSSSPPHHYNPGYRRSARYGCGTRKGQVSTRFPGLDGPGECV